MIQLAHHIKIYIKVGKNIMLSEKKEKKISIRFSEDDYLYLQVLSYLAGMNVSKYVRILCVAAINAIKISENKGKINLEDIKALFID